MGFFESFGSKVQSGAKKAANKSQDMIEVGKLKHKINENEKLIKSKYMDIGKYLYSKYLQGEEVPEEVQGFVDIITLKMKDIDSLKHKIDDIKEKSNIPEEDMDYEESVDNENYDDFEDVEVSDKIEALMGDIMEEAKADDVIYATGDVAEDVAEDISEAVDNTAETVKDAAENAADKVEDVIEDAAETVNDAAEDVETKE